MGFKKFFFETGDHEGRNLLSSFSPLTNASEKLVIRERRTVKTWRNVKKAVDKMGEVVLNYFSRFLFYEMEILRGRERVRRGSLD